MAKKSWIQINGQLVPKDQYYGSNSRVSEGLMVISDIEPFVSSVTGEVINSRRHLREHNRVNDVCHFADFSPEYRAKKEKERIERFEGRTKQDKAHRIELIKRAMENQEKR